MAGRRALRAIPTWCWLGAIVLASFGLRAWLARNMLAPFIFVDELIYSELAKSLADGGSPAIREVSTTGYSLLYPALAAPAYALFDRVPDAYAAVKTVNALVMSLAAVPAYLVARRVVGRGLSLLGALLAVALPSLAYTGTVMTENLFYPLALTCAWALLRVLDRPTWGRSLGLVGLLGLAFATRTQAAVLAPAVATAPLLLVWSEHGGVRRLRPYLPLYGALASAALAALALQALRGQTLQDLLGAYAVVGDESYDLRTVLRYWLWHLEELTLYLAVAPVIALLVLLADVRRLPHPVQAHLAVTVSFVAWVSLAVAAFASQFATRIQERNLFFVAPLVLVALLVWVDRGAPRRRAVALPAAALALALPLAFPYTRFIDTAAISDTLALLPIWSAYGDLLFDSILWTVGVGAALAVALFLLVPARAAIVVPLVVLAFFGTMSRSVWSGERGFVQAGAGALFQGIRSVPRDWIDAAVPAGETVGALWTGRTDRYTINQNEFFNRRLGPVYFVGGATPGGLAEQEVRIGGDDVLRLVDGTPLRERYLLADGTIEIVGSPVARDPALGMTVWKVAGPEVRRADVAVRGLYPGDSWSGPRVRYVRRNCAGGGVVATLRSDPTLFADTPTTVTAAVDGRVRSRVRFGPEGQATIRAPLVPRAGTCVVVYTISPTRNPSRVLPGSTDDRELGTHFDAFTFLP